MTIADVEAKTGLTRANIRYYEREGLLCPERQENGYRNYTEEHVETLLKIKLLRKLSVSLGDIQSIQSGALSLDAVLERQIQQLGVQIQQLNRAQDVCRTICADGADYGHMDAIKYLSLLERDSADELWQKWDQIQETPHPWRRYFARDLDLLIVTMAILTFWFAGLHHYPTTGPGTTFLSTVAALAVTLLVEPLFLHLWATTPGKWLMGIRVHRWDGAKLTYQEGLQRTWDCLLWGLGFQIPLFGLYRFFRSYRQCIAGEIPWDEEIRYTHLEPGPWRTAGLVCAFPLLIALAYPIARIAVLPPNRGDLTVAEFAENYNYYVDAFWGQDATWTMDENGRWQDPPDNTIFLYLGDATVDVAHPDFQYIVEDGVLTGLSYNLSGTGSWVMDYEQPLLLAAMSFVGAQKDLPVLTSDFTRFTEFLTEHSVESFDETWYGVEIQWTLDLDGLAAHDAYLIPEESDTEGSFRIALNMKLT